MDYLVNRLIELSLVTPDKLAVAFKKTTLTYRELIYTAAGMCEMLKAEGIRRGDRICFSATSKVETVVIYAGIHMAGAVAVFLDKNATAESMKYVYDASGSSLILTEKSLSDNGARKVISIRQIYDRAKEFSRDIADINEYRISSSCEELSEILFTSGTTGKPKGVMLSFLSVYSILRNTIDGIGILNDDVLLMPLPLNHSFALRVVRAVLYQGATLILQNGFTFAQDVEKNIDQYACNSMACVPASYEVIRGQMRGRFSEILGSMRYIEFGAGSLSVSQRKTIISLLPNVTIYNTWGSSESGGAIFCNVSSVVPDERYIGALGKPLEGRVQVKIVDENGVEIDSDVDHPGRMILKGDMQMSGYWDDDEATRKTLVDGWLYTGDMAYIKDGYIFMLGRVDNIINVGGDKVSPVEVENVAGQYPGIRECACIGVEDPKGITGEVPMLYMVADPGVMEEDVRQYLSDRLERYKMPAIYRFIDRLPRNRNQKVDYKTLKEYYETVGADELMNPTIRTILSRRSIREFSDREISETIMNMILKCGYHAPSGHNMQSWRFTVLSDKDDISLLKRVTETCAKENGVIFYGFNNPSKVIIISNDSRNPYGCQDASCAAENIMLAAHSYGIGTVWVNALMTLRDKSQVKELLDGYGIPENHVVWATICMGYHESDGAFLQKNSNVVKYISRSSIGRSEK